MGGSGKRDEEEYARNQRDDVPRKVNRLKPGGYGPGAVRTRDGGIGAGNFWTAMWVTVQEAAVTCCGVVVAGRRDRAGLLLVERITVNAEPPWLCLAAVHPTRFVGLGSSSADRVRAGRSSRSTPSRGKPVHMGKGGSGCEKEGCVMGRKTRR